MARFAVAGATSWGLTLAWLLRGAGNEVSIITRTQAEADDVNARHGVARLAGLRLPDDVRAEPAPMFDAFDGMVAAAPAQALRRTIQATGVSRDTPVLSAAKGIELASGLLMSEVLVELGWARERVSAISGPNLAHEIVRGLPAAAVIAAESLPGAERWQAAMSRPTFRTYTSDDLAGVQLAGAYKNVIAIAAGACWGLEFGANAVSTVMTRGLAEMTRLGLAMGAEQATFLGLAGVGDLATTCFSPLSRNRRFGELLAKGRSVADARTEIGETVEGAATAEVALELARRSGVELPIGAEVAGVVRGEKSVLEAMAGLLSRPLKPEAAWPG